MPKTVLVLGADGYLGWPTALHLSAQGHDVVAVDNLIRRRWDREGGTASLVPIKSMAGRGSARPGARSSGAGSTFWTPPAWPRSSASSSLTRWCTSPSSAAPPTR